MSFPPYKAVAGLVSLRRVRSARGRAAPGRRLSLQPRHVSANSTRRGQPARLSVRRRIEIDICDASWLGPRTRRTCASSLGWIQPCAAHWDCCLLASTSVCVGKVHPHNSVDQERWHTELDARAAAVKGQFARRVGFGRQKLDTVARGTTRQKYICLKRV